MRKEVRKGFGWKEFFKPTRLKILLFVVFLLSLPLIIWFGRADSCTKYFPCVDMLPDGVIHFMPLWIFIIALQSVSNWKSVIPFIIPLIISFVLAYVLSCFFTILINKSRTKKIKVVLIAIIIFLSLLSSAYRFYPAYFEVRPSMHVGMNPPRACMNARLGINEALSCYNSLTNDIKIIVTRTEEFNLIGIEIVLEESGQRNRFAIKDKQNESTLVLSQYPSNYSNQPDGFGIFDVPGTNDNRTYIIKKPISNQTNIAVAPIIKVVNTEKVCDATARLTNIKECEPTEEELTYCDKDEDCIIVFTGCCDASLRKAINVKYKEIMKLNCEGVICAPSIPVTLRQPPDTAICVNQKCYIEGEEPK